MVIELPWFNYYLNPNVSVHWSIKSRARKKQKTDAYFLASKAPKPKESETYPLRITFYPPDKRHRDLDNCLAASKGIFDGIAFAWRVNDKQFKPITARFGEVYKGGKITVEVVYG